MVDNIVDNIIESVREDLLQRSKKGIDKYKVTLDRKDLSLKDWLQHAYEECLDQANYLKRSIIEIEAQERKKALQKITDISQEQGLYY